MIMKKLILTILSIVIASSLFSQPSAQMKEAERMYTANNYADAIKTYESILKQGYESAELYYNLGNSYYRNNEITKSILNYERAKMLAPNDEDIRFNLELANQFVVDKIEPLPRPFFVKWWHSLINSNSSGGWAKISIICFILALIGASGYIFASSINLKKISFITGIVMIVISAFSFGFAGKQKAGITNHKSAIVFTPTVTVKSSPDESGTDLFVVHEGLKVDIREELGNWYNIRIADGNSGWVKKINLEKI